jgi:GR25 family glycosyltransferase involved in LPS biosynthesis
MINIREIPIFCINLDRRPERYKLFSEQPGVKEINVERISAIDGTAINIVNNPQISNQTKINIIHKKRRSHGEIDTAGAIGCSLSHYSVWKKFLETDSPFCLVLEDDAKIPLGLADSILTASVNMPADFDVWCLSYKLYDPTLLPTDKADWKSPVNFWGTAAYIMSRKGAQNLMAGFFPIECHLDKYMCLKSLLGHVKLVVNTKFKTYTIHYGTDIQLNRCALCNYPDDFDGILVNKHSAIAYFTCSLIASLIILFQNS